MPDLVSLTRKDTAPAARARPPAGKVFVHTFGCQMNEADSLRMAELLGRHAFAAAAAPEEADLILVNTCAVREKAEQKLLSALGRYREVKARRGALIAVAGCVAQQEKERLLKRVPYVDFVFGPDNLSRLPEMVARARARERFAETGWMGSEEYVFPLRRPRGGARAGHRLRHRHEGLRQRLRLLRGPAHARPRGLPPLAGGGGRVRRRWPRWACAR